MRSRLLLFVATFLWAVAAPAATLADRSLFTQGHWWNEARPGSGFEIFHAGGQAMVIWYTYTPDGKPVWYTAQGEVATLGTPWTLLRHRWANGRKAGADSVGTITLRIETAETAAFEFDLAGTRGTFKLKPFTVSGLGNEVDHSGSWFDPANSGWGITVTEQGDVLGGVLYTYDAGGAPTWLAGFDRNRRDIEMFTYTGSCPNCAWTASTPRSAGRITFDFASETRLSLRDLPAIPMAAGVAIEGAALAQIGRPASSRAADRSLVPFAESSRLKAYIASGLVNYVGSSGVDFSPAPASTTFSGTNLIEAGVDEADLMKSDGEYVYTFAQDAFGARLPRLRIAQVGGGGTSLAFRGEAPLDGETISRAGGGLMLDGTRLVAISGTRASAIAFGPGAGVWSSYSAWVGGKTYVEILDATQRAAPQSRWRARIDGHLVATRRIGETLYVVTRNVPSVSGFTSGYVPAPLRTLERANAVPLEEMLPRVVINGAPAVPLVDASQVFAPPQGDRLPSADMTVVTAIDLAQPRIRQSLAVAGSTDAVYVTETNLYLAGTRQAMRANSGLLLPVQPSFAVTDVHRLRLGTNSMEAVGTGTVEGYLGTEPDKAAFRMGEAAGRLRVVSSATTGQWGASVSNRLTILEPSTVTPGLLRTLSYLPNTARPERIGKPNELLYATRFVGDRLYAVTFLKTDPLYVVDLTNAADPKITGALEVPGFSDYLHPLPGNRLLGFGLDAIPAGSFGDSQFAWFQGLQVAIFDVSEDGKPREMQRVNIGKRGSDSALLKSHHAFSSLARADGTLSFAIPARVHDGAPNGPSVPQSYPYLRSELLRFELVGTRLLQQSSLVFQAPTSSEPYGPSFDPGREDGRSLILGDAVVFVGGGRFWLQSPAGARTGPL